MTQLASMLEEDGVVGSFIDEESERSVTAVVSEAVIARVEAGPVQVLLVDRAGTGYRPVQTSWQRQELPETLVYDDKLYIRCSDAPYHSTYMEVAAPVALVPMEVRHGA